MASAPIEGLVLQIHDWKSESIAKLADALAKAQAEFGPILKKVDNAAFMRNGKASKYADLAAVIEATQPSLAKNGLSVIQMPDVNMGDKSLTLTGLLVHASGEWLKTSLTLPAVQRDKFDPQSCGSAITYARRYQYSALVGAAAEDDDGNAASGKDKGTPEQFYAERNKVEQEIANRLTAELKPWKKGCLSIQGKGLAQLVAAGLGNQGGTYSEASGTWFIPSEMTDKFCGWALKMGVDVSPPTVTPMAAVRAVPPPEPGAYEPTDADVSPVAPLILGVKSIKGQFLAFTWDGEERSCWHQSMWAMLTENDGKPAQLVCRDSSKKNSKTGKPYSNVEAITSLNGVEYEIGQDDKWHAVIQQGAR